MLANLFLKTGLHYFALLVANAYFRWKDLSSFPKRVVLFSRHLKAELHYVVLFSHHKLRLFK